MQCRDHQATDAVESMALHLLTARENGELVSYGVDRMSEDGVPQRIAGAEAFVDTTVFIQVSMLRQVNMLRDALKAAYTLTISEFEAEEEAG